MTRQFILVAFLSALAQLAAFVKLRFTASAFGMGSDLDGYNLAIAIPTLISGIMSGVIQTGFFPTHAQLSANSMPAAVVCFERQMLLYTCCAAIIFSVGLWAVVPWVVAGLVPSNLVSTKNSVALVLPWVALLIPLNIVGDCAGYLLAMRNRFGYAAGAPIVNGLVGAFILAKWPDGGLTGLVASTLLGALAQLVICQIGLLRSGFRIWGPLPSILEMRTNGKKVLALGSGILPGLIFGNLLASLPPVWMVGFGVGAVSAFGYAYRLHMAVIQVFIMSSSTLILARFTTLLGQRDIAGVQRLLLRAAIASALTGITGVLAVWLLGENVLLLIFNGRFDEHAAHTVTNLWFWLTIGLGLVIFSNVVGKLLQAQGRAGLMSMMAGIGLAAVYTCTLILRPYFHEFTVAISLSAYPLLMLIICWRLRIYALSSKHSLDNT